MLQHSESLVQFLEDTNNSVVLLHILLSFPQGYLCVETPGKNSFELGKLSRNINVLEKINVDEVKSLIQWRKSIESHRSKSLI